MLEPIFQQTDGLANSGCPPHGSTIAASSMARSLYRNW